MKTETVYGIFVRDKGNALFGDAPKRLQHDIGLFFSEEAAKPYADQLRKVRHHTNGGKMYAKVEVLPLKVMA